MIYFVVALVLAALLFFGAAYFAYDRAFYLPKRKRKLPMVFGAEQYDAVKDVATRVIEEAYSLPFEEVYIKSYDGASLFGRYYHTEEGAPVHILFHGYRSSACHDFGGRLQFLLAGGQNVLLVDQRAHEKSGGRCLCFGIKERFDALEWARYIEKRCGKETKIVLSGVSMGAATVMMAADLPLPKGVVGIVADSGYSSPRAILQKVVKDLKYPCAPTYFLVRMGGMIYGGFDCNKGSAAEALAKTEIPVLFIHGDDDRFVPHEMTIENYNACKSKKTLFTVKNSGHGLAYVNDPKGYEGTITSFLSELGIKMREKK